MLKPTIKGFIEDTGYKGQVRPGQTLRKEEGILHQRNRVNRGKETGLPTAALLRQVKGAVWLEQRLGDREVRESRQGRKRGRG